MTGDALAEHSVYRLPMILTSLLLACMETPPEGLPGAPPVPGAPAAGTSALPPPPGPPDDGGLGAALGGEGCEITSFWMQSDRSSAELVELAGEVRYSGTEQGVVLVDLIDAASSRVVWGFTCSKLGVFSVQVPAGLGELWAAAYIDLDGDGPSPSDPQGRGEEVVVGTDAIDGVVVIAEDGGAVEGVVMPSQLAPMEGEVMEGAPVMDPGASPPGEPAVGAAAPAGAGASAAGDLLAGDGSLPAGDGAIPAGAPAAEGAPPEPAGAP